MKNWQREFEILREENARLIKEIRNLRCAMVEAASSINPAEEMSLFNQLTGSRGHFIDDLYNPYPEHERHVSEQYMRQLTEVTEVLGGYDDELRSRNSVPRSIKGVSEDGKF